jgi:hypothetical protein
MRGRRAVCDADSRAMLPEFGPLTYRSTQTPPQVLAVAFAADNLHYQSQPDAHHHRPPSRLFHVPSSRGHGRRSPREIFCNFESFELVMFTMTGR